MAYQRSLASGKVKNAEYPELARLRASGDEQGVQRLAVQGLVDRAYAAGAGQFKDPALKAYLMSAAHMRGPAGAMAIMNAAATGELEHTASRIDPENIAKPNSMPIGKLMRRLQIVRNAYDQRYLGDRPSTDEAGRSRKWWDPYGPGLQNRYTRERQFYSELHSQG